MIIAYAHCLLWCTVCGTVLCVDGALEPWCLEDEEGVCPVGTLCSLCIKYTQEHCQSKMVNSRTRPTPTQAAPAVGRGESAT